MTVAGVIAGAGLDDGSESIAQASGQSGPCAAATATTIAAVDSKMAEDIYVGELHSQEVGADIAHIKGSRELLSALASSNRRAVYAAAQAIVYTPHWHIVRLRILKHGRVLADFGGPRIIAPVSGTLRLRGRRIASFVMSVQDDLGYRKLVSRFIGVPVDIYQDGSFLMGTLQPVPAVPMSGGELVTVSGVTYRVSLLKAAAFPSGTLEVALFVRPPSSSRAQHSCAAVGVSEWGSVARHIAALFTPLQASYGDLVETLQSTTGGMAFVRAGSKRLAGTAGPAKIPHRGTVKYRGRSWSVFSWEPVPPARIYFLTPAV